MGYKYSAESDYWSHTLSGLVALRIWGDSGTISLSFGQVFDQVGKRVQGNAPPQTQTGGPCTPVGARTCPLDTTFGGLWYSQVLSATALLQAGYEFAWLEGFLEDLGVRLRVDRGEPHELAPVAQGGLG
jgi:hypothetical protein